MNAERRTQLAWVAGVFALVVAFDQITKAIVRAVLTPDMPARREVFFHFTHQRNEGLVGGLFDGTPAVTYIAPIVATLILLYMFRYLEPASRLQSIAFGMVLGGALGNMLDRFIRGSVTDFLQFHFYFVPFDFPWKYYPAFNAADSAIVVGVIVLVITWNTVHPAASADAANPS